MCAANAKVISNGLVRKPKIERPESYFGFLLEQKLFGKIYLGMSTMLRSVCCALGMHQSPINSVMYAREGGGG